MGAPSLSRSHQDHNHRPHVETMLKKFFKKIVEKQMPSRVLVSVLMVVVVTTFLLPARVHVDAQQIPQQIDTFNLQICTSEIDPNDPYGSLPPDLFNYSPVPSSGQGLPLDLPPVPVGGVTINDKTGAEAAAAEQTSLCGSFWNKLNPINLFGCAAQFLGNFLLVIMALVVGLAGMLLNGAMYLTVNMKDVLQGLPMVDSGWVVFRDVANMLFIFILLYIAIATILNVADTKKMLTTVIVTALLVNFSLFLTKVVVDASNIVALAFYNKILSISPSSDNSVLSQVTPAEWKKGPSWTMLNALKVQTVYDYGRSRTAQQQGGLDSYINASTLGLLGTIFLEPIRVLIVSLLGAIVMLIFAFMMAVGAVLLIVRT